MALEIIAHCQSQMLRELPVLILKRVCGVWSLKLLTRIAILRLSLVLGGAARNPIHPRGNGGGARIAPRLSQWHENNYVCNWPVVELGGVRADFGRPSNAVQVSGLQRSGEHEAFQNRDSVALALPARGGLPVDQRERGSECVLLSDAE